MRDTYFFEKNRRAVGTRKSPFFTDIGFGLVYTIFWSFSYPQKSRRLARRAASVRSAN
jgi:hypothetical protein